MSAKADGLHARISMRESKNCPKCDVELRDERFCNICGWREVTPAAWKNLYDTITGIEGYAESLSKKIEQSFGVQPNDAATFTSPVTLKKDADEVRECKCCGKKMTIRRGSTILSVFLYCKTEEAVFCSQTCFVRFIARQEALKVVAESKNANWVVVSELDGQSRFYVSDPPDSDEEPKLKE